MNAHIPTLDFPTTALGPREAPIGLRCLLYRGGASADRRYFERLAAEGMLGEPVHDRIPLASSIHAFLTGRAPTWSRRTLETHVYAIRTFYAFAEKNALPLTTTQIVTTYKAFCAKCREAKRPMSGYRLCVDISACLSPATGLTTTQLLTKGRVRAPRLLLGVSRYDKVSNQHVLQFIRLLRDLCNGLPAEVVLGPVPVDIALSDGTTHRISTLRQPKTSVEDMSAANRERHLTRRARQLSDQSITSQHRSPLVNLRIESELLLFIQQTGANLTPALTLGSQAWRFRSREGYIELRSYKARAKSDVSFRIYPEYRRHFQSYLTWRTKLFEDEDRLFPFVAPLAGVSRQTKPTFKYLRALCRRIGVTFCPPSALRRSSGNWWENAAPGFGPTFLQNRGDTFQRSYRRPNHQRLLEEGGAFFAGLREQLRPAAGPGVCAGTQPEPARASDSSAPQPDCINAGACLFCAHNRDLKSFDHVWQLVSYRDLAQHELRHDSTASSQGHPSSRVALIEQIGRKLCSFRELGGDWLRWIDEAERRASSGYYHDLFVEQWIVIGKGAASE